MSFANDKLYKGYLRRKMPAIVSTVKVREIVTYLPCLTDHDRENIDAKRETCGNYDSMVLLLDCLKRRENWPEQFIEALEACEQPTIAAEIRAEYNALRGINNSNPSSPSTTVVRAHVHPTPSVSHLSIPESGANSQVAVAPPAEASAPPEPAAQASPPLEIPLLPQVPQISAAQVPEAVSPPEPVPEPQQPTQVEVAPPPSTPPPSPETKHTQATTTPPLQREINSHQEPVENSESDIQDISGDNDVIPDQVSAGNGKVSINSVATPRPSRPGPDPHQTTTTSTQVRPPRSPSPTQINSDVTDGSSFPMMTPEKPPVQDTTPPGDKKSAAVLQPEETSEPPATQVVESSPQTETETTTSPLPGAAGMDASLFDDNTLCLSKPGQLISIHANIHNSPTIPAPSQLVEPYSGNSERLEISDAAVTSTHVSSCSAVSSATVNTISALPCLENGIALSHNEPEENHYDSPCQSLEMQEVLENVGHISEEPSILNLDGQSSTPQVQIINGEADKEITSAPPLSTSTADTVSSVNTPSSEYYHPSEPAPADSSPETLQEEKTASRALPANTKYILTAAGVGACALLIAWKFKN
ncbi:mitochondrial antiviral-signaling protein [Siniperca chuatsi]|uniref:mitochondrial antiviral-signaling protein n=1 Tax=Siniperca chuatsi TaxID=119488 RepID=UPI001CE06B1E|nr:mitochondrial antiviral-signaling protein [Siniperca chuatsi]QQD64402.1 mitochondrial antiviral signalling Protein [Siniperca chuatsi]